MEKSQILMISVALIVLLFVGFFVYNQIKEGKIFLQPRNPSDPRTDIPKTPTCLGSPKYEYCEGNLRLYSPECNVDKWIYENQECAYGCANGTCLGKKCPATCDDGNLCTTSFCNASTNFDCKYTNLEGPQPGCNTRYSECRYDFCSAGECIVLEEQNCCEGAECGDDDGNGGDNGPNPPVDQRNVGTQRLQDLLNRFPELLRINNGKMLSFDIPEESGTYHYFAVKEYGKFKVSESNSLGDVTLYISEASFNELDESSNICPVLKELMEDRIITIDIHVKGVSMLPYCNMQDCLDYPGIEEDKEDCDYFGY